MSETKPATAKWTITIKYESADDGWPPESTTINSSSAWCSDNAGHRPDNLIAWAMAHLLRMLHESGHCRASDEKELVQAFEEGFER